MPAIAVPIRNAGTQIATVNLSPDAVSDIPPSETTLIFQVNKYLKDAYYGPGILQCAGYPNTQGTCPVELTPWGRDMIFKLIIETI